MANKKQLTELHDLDAAEVSLVPIAANAKKFLIFKGGEGSGPQQGAGAHKTGVAATIHDASSEKVGEIHHDGKGGFTHESANDGEQTGSHSSIKEAHSAWKSEAHEATRGEGASAREASSFVNGTKLKVHKAMTSQEDLQKAIAAADPEVMKRVDGAMKDHLAGMKKNAADAAASSTDESSMVSSAVKAVARILTPFKEKIPAPLMHAILNEIGFAVEEAQEGPEPGAHSEEDHFEKEIGGEGDAGTIGQGETMPGHIESKEAGFETIPAEHLEKAAKGDFSGLKDHLEKMGYRKYPDEQPAIKSKDGKTVEGKEKNVEKTAQLSPEMQAKLEAVFKSNEQLVQKNSELASEVAALRALDKQKEVIAKAASLSGAGLPQDTLVAILSDAQKAGPEAYERVVKGFEAISEQTRVAKSFGGDLYSEKGSNLSGQTQGSENAWARIEKAAEGLVQKSTTPISKEDGIAQFLSTADGKRLYAEHQAGRKDGI